MHHYRLQMDAVRRLSDERLLELSAEAAAGILRHSEECGKAAAGVVIAGRLMPFTGKVDEEDVRARFLAARQCTDAALELYSAQTLDGQDASHIWRDMNLGLRRAGCLGDMTPDDVERMVRNSCRHLAAFALLLMEAIRTMPEAARSVVKAYRGLCVPTQVLDAYRENVGSAVVWPAFQSCSLDAAKALDFPMGGAGPLPGTVDVVFEVTSIARPVIEGLSHFATEREVLLPPGTMVIVGQVVEMDGRPMVCLCDVNVAGAQRVYAPSRRRALSPELEGWRTGAAKGETAAMVQWGFMKEEGLVMQRNVWEAAWWYTRAAEAESSAEMVNLGRCLRDGLGVAVGKGEGAP
jgi:hypothetical protein